MSKKTKTIIEETRNEIDTINQFLEYIITNKDVLMKHKIEILLNSKKAF